jgi:antitoxin component YwqK of YwqJK toxin-antitoxin module
LTGAFLFLYQELFAIFENHILNYFLLILVVFIAACNPEDSFENGEKTFYFPGTNTIKKQIHYKNGKKNGLMQEFYQDGKLKARQFFVNDSLDDTTVVYHPNGKLKLIHTYKNRLKHGFWRDYNKEGKLYSELCFKNGKLDGTCSEYSYRSVKLQARINYHDGAKHGVQEHYYPSGKIKSREYFFMGQICKGTEEWFENGNKINNDFNILIREQDAALLENTLIYKIRIEGMGPEDRIYRVLRPGSGNRVGDCYSLPKEGDAFICKFNIPKGSFVMEEVTVAAYKKTAMGNTVIKTRTFNAASNNFY